MRDYKVKETVVALEECGYQCQYIEGTITATRGSDVRYFVEDSRENAVGLFPADVVAKLNTLNESQIEDRFSKTTLYEMGYGSFEPSADKPTGTEEPSKNRFKVKDGEKAVTSDNPEKPKGVKGLDNPVDDDDLPNDYTGGSKNNEDADIPNTDKGSVSTVGSNGGEGGGKGAGPDTSKKAEKTQAMNVGNSVYQQDAANRDTGKDYTGSKVGSVGNKKSTSGSKVANAGTMPAKLPTDQPAQSLAKIPSVKSGKMAVTGSTVESVLASLDAEQTADDMMASTMDEAEQKAKQFSNQNLVLLNQSKDGSWSVGSTFDKGWSPSDYMNVKESASDHSTTGGGKAKIIATNENIENIRRMITTNPKIDIATLGQEIFMTESIAGAMDAVGKVAADVATGTGKVAKRLAKPVAKGVGKVTKAVGTGIEAAGEEIGADEAIMKEAIRTFPKYNGILEKLYPGPYISRTTFKQIDLADIERKLTPHLVEAIAMHLTEQGVDAPPQGALPDEEEMDPDLDADPMADPALDAPMDGGEDGMDAPEMGAEKGAPDMGAEGEEPLDDAGMGGEDAGLGDMGGGGMGGAPDIGAEPAPQPMGGDLEASGMPSPEPELPSEDRWARARENCPDCDDATLSELVQYDIVNDLQKAMFDKFVNHLTKTKEQNAKVPLVASKNSNIRPQSSTKDLNESKVKKNPFVEQKRFEKAFYEDPAGAVSHIVEALMQDSTLINKASALVLGIEEGNNYQRREVESAANQLRGLGDQVYDVRNQLGNIINSTAGDILRRVSSPLARGAFASEAQQMITKLQGIQGQLDQFIKQVPHWVDAFDSAYSNLGVSASSGDTDMGAEETPEMPMDNEMDAGMDSPVPPMEAGSDIPMPPEGDMGMEPEEGSPEQVPSAPAAPRM